MDNNVSHVSRGGIKQHQGKEELTVGVQSVGVGVEDSLGGTERGGGSVAVGVVSSTRRVCRWGMGELVETGRALVLGVASPGQDRELGNKSARGQITFGTGGLHERHLPQCSRCRNLRWR